MLNESFNPGLSENNYAAKNAADPLIEESKKIIKEFRETLARNYFPQGLSPGMMELLSKVESGLNTTYQSGLVDGTAHLKWSNSSCLGFAVMAAVRIGLDEDSTQKLIADMLHSFDFVSPGLAATVYNQSKYRL